MFSVVLSSLKRKRGSIIFDKNHKKSVKKKVNFSLTFLLIVFNRFAKKT